MAKLVVLAGMSWILIQSQTAVSVEFEIEASHKCHQARYNNTKVLYPNVNKLSKLSPSSQSNAGVSLTIIVILITGKLISDSHSGLLSCGVVF